MYKVRKEIKRNLGQKAENARVTRCGIRGPVLQPDSSERIEYGNFQTWELKPKILFIMRDEIRGRGLGDARATYTD